MNRDHDIVHYLSVLYRRRLIVIAMTLIGLVAAVGYSARQETLYRSVATVSIAPDSSAGFLEGAAVDQNRLLENEIQFLRGPRVADAAAAELGYPASVAVGEADLGDVLAIAAVSPDRGQAADIANAYAAAFVEQRRQRTIDDYLETAEAVQERLDGIESELDSLAFGSTTREALERQRDAYLGILQNLGLGADLGGGIDATVLTPAVPAEGPFQPSAIRNGFLGALLGFLVGCGLAFLRDHLDHRIRSVSDLERAAAGSPTLGLVPAEAVARKDTSPLLVSVDDPDGEGAEAFRSLRAAVEFLHADRGFTTVQIAARAGEGKTTTTANLAIALARTGRRVIVVDADLRRPRLHVLFGADAEPGLTDALQRSARAGDVAVRALDDLPLALIPAGSPSAIPSELLGGTVARSLLASLADRADVVLLDSAPVLPVADGRVLAARVDATIVVVQHNSTTTDDLEATLERLAQVHANVIGTVLNRADDRGRSGYSYVRPDRAETTRAPRPAPDDRHHRRTPIPPPISAPSSDDTIVLQ